MFRERLSAAAVPRTSATWLQARQGSDLLECAVCQCFFFSKIDSCVGDYRSAEFAIKLLLYFVVKNSALTQPRTSPFKFR